MSKRAALGDGGWVRQRLRGLGAEPKVRFDRLEGIDRGALSPAAVLIPVVEIDEEPSLLFTLRPETMAEHSGEVSFPGGRQEPGDDDLLWTALRESDEEIGLKPKDVEVFGSLVQMPTVTGYEITAYVGEVPWPYELCPNPREIEELFDVPLRCLADPKRHRIEQHQWKSQAYDLHFYEYDPHVIWGATGYMVNLLLEFLVGDHPMEEERRFEVK